VGAKYTIDGGEAGKARLDVLARVCAPGTATLFEQVGVKAGAQCVDVGCGGGHVSRDLAARVGVDGSVVGIDLDPVVLDLAGAESAALGIANVEFRCCDAAQLDGSTYDLAYARCLLSHVGKPAQVVAAMALALKPGGVMIVEDIDFTGYFCEPPCRSHDLYLELYRETVRRRGGNADLGLMLPSLLQGAGLERIGVAVSQVCGLQGEAKLLPPLTLARIADAVVSEGVATALEVEQAVAELYDHAADPTTLMGMPRLIQAWGSVSTTG
jgi:SAM-dependent methyltransferase